MEVQNVILRYERSIYDQRISVMNSDLEKLRDHVENLEKFASQLRNLWTDDNGTAETYSKLIVDMKIDLSNQINRLEDLKAVYENIRSDFQSRTEITEGLVNSVASVVSGLPTLQGK